MLSDVTYSAYDRIINLCIDRGVDFLIISGDIYDSGDRNVQAQLRFVKGLQKLAEHGIQSYLVHGNHDPLPFWSKSVALPPEACRFTSSDPECVVHKSGKNPVAYLIGASIPERVTSQNLVATFPKKEKNWPFTIGIVHCSVDGAEGHDPYAPCKKDELISSGYDYWALGHIHLPTIVQSEYPPIIYPGNPQGRNMGECGPRGCYVVTVDESGTVDTEFVEINLLRWERCTINTNGITTLDAFKDKVCTDLLNLSDAAGRRVVCRVTLEGINAIHSYLSNQEHLKVLQEQITEDLATIQYPIYIERFENRTYPMIDRDVISNRPDLVGEICRIVDGLLSSDDGRKRIEEALAPLFRNIRYRSSIESCSDEELPGIIREAEGILLSRLVGGEE